MARTVQALAKEFFPKVSNQQSGHKSHSDNGPWHLYFELAKKLRQRPDTTLSEVTVIQMERGLSCQEANIVFNVHGLGRACKVAENVVYHTRVVFGKMEVNESTAEANDSHEGDGVRERNSKAEASNLPFSENSIKMFLTQAIQAFKENKTFFKCLDLPIPSREAVYGVVLQGSYPFFYKTTVTNEMAERGCDESWKDSIVEVLQDKLLLDSSDTEKIMKEGMADSLNYTRQVAVCRQLQQAVCEMESRLYQLGDLQQDLDQRHSNWISQYGLERYYDDEIASGIQRNIED